MPCIFPVCSVKNCCYLHRAMMAVYCNAIHLVRRLVHPSRCSADKQPTISPKLRHMRMPKRTCMPKKGYLNSWVLRTCLPPKMPRQKE
jgi:hypothetical protein